MLIILFLELILALEDLMNQTRQGNWPCWWCSTTHGFVGYLLQAQELHLVSAFTLQLLLSIHNSLLAWWNICAGGVWLYTAYVNDVIKCVSVLSASGNSCFWTLYLLLILFITVLCTVCWIMLWTAFATKLVCNLKNHSQGCLMLFGVRAFCRLSTFHGLSALSTLLQL